MHARNNLEKRINRNSYCGVGFRADIFGKERALSSPSRTQGMIDGCRQTAGIIAGSGGRQVGRLFRRVTVTYSFSTALLAAPFLHRSRPIAAKGMNRQ